MSKILNGFEINYEGKEYILLIDIQEDKLKFKCLNNLSGDYFSSKAYKIDNLHSMNKCFRFTNDIEEIQTLLNNSIEKGKIGLLEDLDQISIFFNLNNGDDEIIIGFSLMKQKLAKKNKSIRESKNLKENRNNDMGTIPKENGLKNQDELVFTEQIKKLNEEIEELKKENKSLKEENDLLKKDKEELKDYKKKYETLLISPSPLKKDNESEGNLKINYDANEDKVNDNIINSNKIENDKENEKSNLFEQNLENDNNMNIIYNDNYENESEIDKGLNEQDNKLSDMNDINQNIQPSEKEDININNVNLENETNEKKDQISFEKENSNKENHDSLLIEKIKSNENDEFEPNLENQKKIIEDEEVNVNNADDIIEKDNEEKQIEKVENKEEEILQLKNEGNDKDEIVKDDEPHDEDEIEYIRNNEIINNIQNETTQEKNEIKIEERVEVNIEKNDISCKENELKENNNEIRINNENENNTNEINYNKIEIKKNENTIEQIKENENIIDNNKNENKKEENIFLKNEIILDSNQNIQENINLEENKIVKNEDISKKEEGNINKENKNEEKVKEIINQINIIDKKEDKEKSIDFEVETKKIETQENQENISNVKKEEIIKDKKEKIEEIDLDIREIEDKEIELGKNIKKLKINNTEKELKSISNSISEIEINEYENNKYFYNDKINPSYTLKKLNKKDSFTSSNNKSHNFEIESPMKNSFQTMDKNKNILKGEIFHDSKELDFISKNIHKNKYKINLNLIYKASLDGDKSSIFHEKCDKAQTTIVLVETKNNKRFGGYTKRTWRGSNIDKMDNDSFIFSLDKKEIYNVIKGKKVIGSYNEISPYFLGAFKIYDDAFIKGGCLLRNEKNYEIKDITELIEEDKSDNLKDNNPEIKFEVKEIEVYEIKIA